MGSRLTRMLRAESYLSSYLPFPLIFPSKDGTLQVCAFDSECWLHFGVLRLNAETHLRRSPANTLVNLFLGLTTRLSCYLDFLGFPKLLIDSAKSI